MNDKKLQTSNKVPLYSSSERSESRSEGEFGLSTGSKTKFQYLINKKVVVVLAVFTLFAVVLGSFNCPECSAKEEPIQITFLPPLCESMGLVSVVKCKGDPLLKSLGCDDVQPPPDYWGGLKPPVPMGLCLNHSSSGDSVRIIGCSAPMRERFIVALEKGDKWTTALLSNPQEVRQFFAPIETREEAISYISALTGTFPIYSFPDKYFIRTPDENGKYTESNPKPTEVKESKKGYFVKLFDEPKCGCHRPELISLDFFVTKDGSIEMKKKKVIWQAHRLYNICID